MNAENLSRHLAKLEELADAWSQDGYAIPLARSKSVPVEIVRALQDCMRVSFLLGGLAATGLIDSDGADVPDEWLKKNKIPNPSENS